MRSTEIQQDNDTLHEIYSYHSHCSTSLSGCNKDIGCTHLVSLFPDAGLTEDVIHWGGRWTILETAEFHISTQRLENNTYHVYPFSRIVFFVSADTPRTIDINTINLEVSNQQLGSEKLSLTQLNLNVCSDNLCKNGELSAPLTFEASKNQGMFFHCLLYTSPSPRDKRQSRMPSSA